MRLTSPSDTLKNIIFLGFAQIIIICDPYISSLYKTLMKKDPSFFLFVLCHILPPVLFGIFLALPTWHRIKRSTCRYIGLTLILLNSLLLFCYLRGYTSFPSLSTLYPIILVGYGFGKLIYSPKN